MHREEIKRSLHMACGHSTLLQRSLFTVMDWLTGQSWHVRREIRKWMRDAPPHAHILDAGTGYGHQAYWLSKQNHRHSVLAIDESREHVCRGNAYVRDAQLNNLLFRTAALESFKADEAFDLILCTDAISNLADEESVLHNLHESLRDEGLLIATAKRRPPEVPTNQPANGYDMAELKQMFRNSGFHKVKAHYTGGWFGQGGRYLGVSIPLSLLRTSRLFAVLMPFYFVLVTPVVILFNWLDSHTAQTTGKGILLLARK